MTKFLTIDVSFDKSQNEIIFVANVIANDQENIVILKELIADKEQTSGIHCIGLKLSHCFQQCYQLLPALCCKGQIYLRCNNPDIEIQEAIQQIAKIILSFIL